MRVELIFFEKTRACGLLAGTKNKKSVFYEALMLKNSVFLPKEIGFIFLRPFSPLDVPSYASRGEERTILPKTPSALAEPKHFCGNEKTSDLARSAHR